MAKFEGPSPHARIASEISACRLALCEGRVRRRGLKEDDSSVQFRQ